MTMPVLDLASFFRSRSRAATCWLALALGCGDPPPADPQPTPRPDDPELTHSWQIPMEKTTLWGGDLGSKPPALADGRLQVLELVGALEGQIELLRVQHLQDDDVVLIDATNPFGSGKLLPQGILLLIRRGSLLPYFSLILRSRSQFLIE